MGDSYHWNYGFNYTEWAIKHGPFYLNDTLGELNYFAIATCYILPCIVQVVKYSDQNHIFKLLVFLCQVIKFIMILKWSILTLNFVFTLFIRRLSIWILKEHEKMCTFFFFFFSHECKYA